MYSKLTSWDNLLLAYRKASKGKRGQSNVAYFEFRLEDNLLALQADLQAFTYQPGAYASFYIHEPKRRLISAAPFRDRVAHHALCNVIEPLFERSFIFDSYANRVYKGTHRALQRAQFFSRRYKYFLQCDLRQFFPSIDHTLLRIELERKIKDEHVLWLCDQILHSGAGVLSHEYEMVYFPGDDIFSVSRARGLPIGNLTSQFWCNIYLNRFDHFITRHLRPAGYLRYVDDFLLFDNDKAKLNNSLPEIEAYLANLRVTIHPNARTCPAAEGIPFLGFNIFPNKRRLKRRKGLYYQRKLRNMLNAYQTGKLSFTDLNASVQGWANHVRYANTVGLRKAILGKMKIPKRET